jgi:hypothetical protein
MYLTDFIKHIRLINLVVKIANHVIKYYTVCPARNKWMSVKETNTTLFASLVLSIIEWIMYWLQH